MIDYKVGICGYGYVGKGIHRLLKDSVVAIYDPYINDVGILTAESYGYKDKSFKDPTMFEDLDLVVISVMTKENEDGTCDTSIVEGSLKWLKVHCPDAVIIIKSAIVPSEVKRLIKDYKQRIVISPEFMGESKYFTPFWKYPDPVNMESHTWQVFGGDRKDTTMCVEIFKRRMSVDTQFWQTDAMTASLSKYIENSFFAAKVTFCNEWHDIAKAYGVDWNELRELWLLDPRINKNHTLVFERDRGYGGKCFPKDVRAIISDSEKMGYSAELMRAVDEVNERIRYEQGTAQGSDRKAH
jgi:UDPglucose 6-dehydrogenase